MRLFEAIVEANHRAVAGDPSAGVRVVDYETELPVAALTCIDPRLNALFPNVLGLPADQFIWLRNAGNIIFSPLSSMTRSLALACAIKGAKEIAVIGHTDCQVAKTTAIQLIERFKNLGIERHLLPENINEFFSLFASERQNVSKACDLLRQSPLIGPRVPVHGLVVDVETGKLEWVVNGYQDSLTPGGRWNAAVQSAGHTLDAMKSLADFKIGEMKFPETKIGEVVTKTEDWLSKEIGNLELKHTEHSNAAAAVESAVKAAEKAAEVAKAASVTPPKMPLPPPIRPRMHMKRGGK